MPSTYTNNLGVELPANGEQDGTWGTITNTNMSILDRAINGSVVLSLSGTTSTLTTSDGILSNGQYKALILGGTPSGTHTITISPNDAQKIYYVYNLSGQSVVFTQGSGTNVTIASGDSGIIYSDGGGTGAGVVNLTNHFAMNSVKITGGSIDGTAIGGASPATITGTTGSFSSVTLPAATTEPRSIEVGQGRAGNGASLVDLVGDATYTDYGARFIRENTGPNAETSIYHRGTSALRMITQEVAPITFSTTTTERMRVHASGGVSIGNTTDPGADNLSVTGTVNATTLSIGGTAITSTAAELNILDGVTSTAAELNVLDGIPATLTSTELGYVDGVTSPIQAQINAISGVPSGAVMHFAMNTPPTGWLKANGAAVSRTTYAALFAAIGTTFGVGDGSTTFNLPDLRAEFLRGWDDGRGVDTGRAFGSAQATRVNNVQTVSSVVDYDIGPGSVTINDNGATTLRLYSGGASGTSYSHTFAKKGGDTYPRNVALLACIKI